MGLEEIGICPNCETRRGPVGDPCPSDVCGRKGYAFVPLPWYRSAKEFSLRKRRPMDPLLGLYLDRYLLAGKLGEGGMGAVYLGIQRPLNREVAVKVISGLEMTKATVTRFEREARAISVLDHPNIVKLYDYGIGDLGFQVPYMALEYVRHGRTLRRALSEIRQETDGAPIAGEVVLSIFRQILHALGTAHAMGIVHRDMKPENVMLTSVLGNPHLVKVLDFGLAKAVADVSGFDGTVSRTGMFLGTPCYMAPEQALGRSGQAEVDGRVDLYAVGVMLYEVFTGVRPFGAETPQEFIAQKVDPNYRPLDFPEARGLPRSLKSFLERAMAPLPRDRFAGAEEMLAAFEEALAGRQATAVGLAPGRPGSSDERPATPESHGSAEGTTLDPTMPIRGDEAILNARSQTTGSNSSHQLSPQRSMVRRRALAIAAVIAVVAAVGGGIWLSARPGEWSALSAETTPAPVSGVPEPQAPLAPRPVVETDAVLGTVAVSEPARGAEPPGTGEPEVAEPAEVVKPAPVVEPVVKPVGFRVRFESEPGGAQVFLGGRLLGETPFETVMEGQAGMREMSFRRKGHREETVRMEVQEGSVVRAVLRRLPGRGPVQQAKPKKDDYPEL